MSAVLPTRRRRAAGRQWRLKQLLPYLPALPTLIFLLAFFLLPVGEILRGSFLDNEGHASLTQFARIAHTPVYAKVLWITFAISLATSALSVLLGYPVAYLMSRLSPRVRERWLLWIVLPFWTSYIVKTYAWMLLLTKTGVLSTIVLGLGLVQSSNSLTGIVPSLAGVLVGMVHAMLPLAVMTMLPVMRNIDDRLGQAAQTLGADRSIGFFTVFLPLSSPGAAAAGLLVFITSLGFFIVPSLLGSPKETMIAQLVISSVLDLFDMHFAGALSTVLLVFSTVIFLLYDRMVGLSTLTGEASLKVRRHRGQAMRQALLLSLGRVGQKVLTVSDRVTFGIRAGAGRGAGSRAMGAAMGSGWGPLRIYTILLILVLVAPILVVIPFAFTKSAYIAFPPHWFSLKWFAQFLDSPVWTGAILRSFEVGFATALLSLILGFGATLAMTRMSPAGRKPLFAFLIAPLIVPRIVVAVGLLYLFAYLGLTGSNLGLIIGHTVLALPYVVVTLAAGFRQFDWRLDDAARVMGASPARRIATILLPLLAASITAAFLFAFIVSFDDLTIAIFVSGGINTTLPKQMWDDIQLALTPTLAAVSTALVFGIAAVVVLASFLRRRTR